VIQKPVFKGDVLQVPPLAPKDEAAPPLDNLILATVRGHVRGFAKIASVDLNAVATIPADQLLEVRGELDEAMKAAGELRAVITSAIESAAVGAA
jgi:hypothetical protein